ncbi:MAG TPA: hypothetical protein VLB44_12150 [Kofleriaceae bacterium]|nr:hypothetical protein [Kofleriaceae bacterium]
MWRLLLLLATCACNQVFGLRETQVVDAAYYDAPIDAPFRCPDLGGAPPLYSRLVHQVVTQDCWDYTFSTNPDIPIAVGFCANAGTGTRVLEESPVDEDGMHPIAELAPVPAVRVIDQFRLAPEGDEAYARVTATSTATLSRFRRSSTGAWSKDADLTIPIMVLDSVGSVTRRSLGPRLIVQRYDRTFHEYVPDGTGAWMDVQSYAPTAFGLTLPSDPRITPDGLRMIFTANSGLFTTSTYFTDRASVSEAFGPPRLLADVSIALTPVMTEDCARLYFTALGSVLWVQQR